MMVAAVCASATACAVLGPVDPALGADGRIYERVTPTLKNGSAGINNGGVPTYATASSDGDSLLYQLEGAIDSSSQGADIYTSATRRSAGWGSRQVAPRPAGTVGLIGSGLRQIFPDASRQRFVFTALQSYHPDNPTAASPIDSASGGVYYTAEGVATDWLSRPLIADPTPALGSVPQVPAIAGGSDDLRRVYFTVAQTLLPGEESRAALFAGAGSTPPRGFYETDGGQLKAAGVLPNGTLNPNGAAPAGGFSSTNPGLLNPNDSGNQVSRDGETAFFVSPDPSYVGSANPNEPIQLYVRRSGQTTRLISRDVGSTPAATGVANDSGLKVSFQGDAYLLASPDGSRAYFRSSSALTADAPADGSTKTYEYDVAADTVTYRPEIPADARWFGVSDDGKQLLWEDVNNLKQISLWTGERTQVVANLGDLAATPNESPASVTADGSVWAFATNAPLADGTNRAGAYKQVYRYVTATGSLQCVSCPAGGADATGDSNLSLPQDQGAFFGALQPNRTLTADGTTVFFDSPNALVDSDSNGRRDVYAYRDGRPSLISTGRASTDAWFLDASQDGRDVFFSTREGVLADDTNGQPDIYDARQDGGFAAAAAAAPCDGDCAAIPAVPGVPTLVSGLLGGDGNAKARRRARLDASVSSTSTGRTVRVVTRVATSGRLSITGASVISFRRDVRRASRIVASVKLSQTARRTLARNKKLRLRVTVAFRPRSQTTSKHAFNITVRRK